MDEKFHHIIPFFTINRANVNLDSLVQNHDTNPIVMCSFISFEHSILLFQNNIRECLENLPFDDSRRALVIADSTVYESNFQKQPDSASLNNSGIEADSENGCS